MSKNKIFNFNALHLKFKQLSNCQLDLIGSSIVKKIAEGGV